MNPEEKTVYLDHSATAPMPPEVAEAMFPFLRESFANPSGYYRAARSNRTRLRKFRNFFAETLNTEPDEIIFTSGGTESNNIALEAGCLFAKKKEGKNHLILGGGEHPSVFRTAEKLQTFFGFDLTFLALNREGEISEEELSAAIRPETALVSLILGNNEIGTFQSPESFGELLQERKIPLHLDAIQSFGWYDFNLTKMPVDSVSFSAHKFGGPKGVGILYKKSSLGWAGRELGGSQENGLRAGTENLAGIAGAAKAAEIFGEKKDRIPEIQSLRDKLIRETLGLSSKIRLTGSPENRLPFHASFIVPGVRSEVSMMKMDLEGICISSGSACNVGNPAPSRTLLNMGFSAEDALCAIRATLGIDSQASDIRRFTEVLQKIIG